MNPILNYDENFKVLQVRPKKICPNFLSSPHLHARKFRGNELLIITFCHIGWQFRNPTIKKAMEKEAT